jgi:gamma-glutamyltranspeptidase
MQVLERVLQRGEDLAAAIGGARIHAEARRLLADEELGEPAARIARELGLALTLMPGRDSAMGAVQGVARDGDTMEAVGDPRAGAVGRLG